MSFSAATAQLPRSLFSGGSSISRPSGNGDPIAGSSKGGDGTGTTKKSQSSKWKRTGTIRQLAMSISRKGSSE